MEKLASSFRKIGLGGNSYSPMLCKDVTVAPSKRRSKCMKSSPPAHYSFEIKSFSLVSLLEKFDSPTFEIDEYKWKLCVYPNGKKVEGGDGHVSLYLSITDTEALPRGWEVKTFFRLFMFNQISGEYLLNGVIHETIFHARNKEQGFPRFISLKTFKRRNGGYLINNDSFVIGADVYVVQNRGKGDTFSRISGGIITNKQICRINISNTESGSFCCPKFTVGKCEWAFKFHPKETIDGKCYVSVFLELVGSKSLSRTQQVYVVYSISINGQAQGILSPDISHTGQFWFSRSRKSSGCQKFVSHDELRDPENNYLVEDKFSITAEVNVIGISSAIS